MKFADFSRVLVKLACRNLRDSPHAEGIFAHFECLAEPARVRLWSGIDRPNGRSWIHYPTSMTNNLHQAGMGSLPPRHVVTMRQSQAHICSWRIQGPRKIWFVTDPNAWSEGNYPIDKVIKAKANTCLQIGFFEKVLDTIAIDTLYKRVRAISGSRTVRKKLSMMTSRTHQKPVDKWHPRAAMNAVVCALGLSSASVSLRTNIFGGRLGQETSIDSRRIRQ